MMYRADSSIGLPHQVSAVVMSKHRSSLDIVADVLKAASDGAIKTRILYRANLSYKLLEKYLEVTIRSGFLQNSSESYKLTESGKAFLEKYNRFHDRRSKVEGSLNELDYERKTLEQAFKEAQSTSKPSKIRIEGREE